MLNVGDKVTVQLKVSEIVKNKDGITYGLVPVKGNEWHSLKIHEHDIKQVNCNHCTA